MTNKVATTADIIKNPLVSDMIDVAPATNIKFDLKQLLIPAIVIIIVYYLFFKK